jgi:hypothetical protein
LFDLFLLVIADSDDQFGFFKRFIPVFFEMNIIGYGNCKKVKVFPIPSTRQFGKSTTVQYFTQKPTQVLIYCVDLDF